MKLFERGDVTAPESHLARLQGHQPRANSGIGKETALGLARIGARVVMVCRSAEKGKAVLEEVRRESGSSQVDLLIADMSSQASIRALAEQIQRKYPRLDVLVNNAGGGTPSRTLSVDGIEMTLSIC